MIVWTLFLAMLATFVFGTFQADLLVGAVICAFLTVTVTFFTDRFASQHFQCSILLWAYVLEEET